MASFERVWAEFKRNWVLWIILNFSGGMKTLVNQTEQPFARSLVVCDTPVLEGNYTGSRWCGDRLKVLEQGFHISSVGQSQENFAMLCSLAMVGVCIGAFGRKFTVLLGLSGTTASVALFVLASSSPEMGRLLFSMGQGLQGLYPVEYIFGIVVNDISTQKGNDGEATYGVKFYEGVLGVAFWFGLGYLVQFAELTEYQMLWSAIFALNIGMISVAFYAYPETQPEDKEKSEKSAEETDANPVAKMFNEVKSYGVMLKDFRCRRYLMNFFTRNIMEGFKSGVMSVMLMAYHGWSQPKVVTFWIITFAGGMPFGGIMEKLIGRFGYHDTYCGAIIYFVLVANCGLALTVPISEYGILFLWSCLLLSGFGPLQAYVDSRFCEPENLHRFATMQWVLGYFQGIFLLPMYSWFFNAEATTWLSRSIPSFISVFFCFLNILTVFFGIYDMDGKEGFGITLRQFDALKAKDDELWGILSRAAQRKAELKAKEAEAEKKTDEPPSEGQEPPPPEPVVSEEVWKEAGLRAAFSDAELQACGGPMYVHDQLSGFLRTVNNSPKAARELLEALDKALASARTWAGETEEPPAAKVEDKKKV